MDAIDAIRTRRSVRQYSDEKISKEILEEIIDCGRLAATARNIQPWEFIVVTNKGTIEKLSQAKAHGSKFMKNATLAVVVCADPATSDVWIEDASIASLILHLAACDLGLGSCWVQIRQREHDSSTSAEQYVRDLLGIGKGMVVEAIVAIGYGAEDKPGHPGDTLLRERIYWDRYGDRG